SEDPIVRAFKENPVSDGIGGVRQGRGGLPVVPTELVRVLNAGNEIEILQYPSVGDRIFSQAKLANVVERTGREGNHMLIVTNETVFTNQDGDVLCITRASSIRR
ncbi:MAG: MaoC family dehydratase N-terminal domain-containing protein, partial [Dehalococcoidia bacterium]